MQRISAVNPDHIDVSVVTVEEQVRGWLNAIAVAKAVRTNRQ
jgi:hypothetical protein